MITISLCMIVKDEEKVLARCLDSLADIADEIVIADTGSSDATKQIARRYTDKVYDFSWTGSFADARNFVAGKATMDYIYTADADEWLDEQNREKLKQLKSVLLPEVEIVQMLYCTQKENNTLYNFDSELRPKLYRRVRPFVWIDPIHETLRLDPVVYDSEIQVRHCPEKAHAQRDFGAMLNLGLSGQRLSKKIHHMYAMELFHAGDDRDFIDAAKVFARTLDEDDRSLDELKEAFCVLARAYRVSGDLPKFFSCALKDVSTNGCAEICCELAKFYEENGDWSEAALWYENALTQTESILDIRTSKQIPQEGLARCKKREG